jgi:SurA N-terminal domain
MSDSFRRACLVAAVILGCAFSAFKILHDVRVPMRFLPGTAARVNGRSIDADSVNRTVAGMDARNRRFESAARHDVLSRMIDEELLVQHALASGAAETSPEVRAALVRSAITRVNAEVAAEPIPDRELEEYFRAYGSLYATSARFEVTPFYYESQTFPDLAAAQSRAEAARAQLSAGVPISQVIDNADRLPFVSPGQLVTARTLASYFGPVNAHLLEELTPGHTTAATPLGHGVLFIYLNQKAPSATPSLASVHDLVLADAMRERQEHALENLLTELHKSARIELSDSPPATAAR